MGVLSLSIYHQEGILIKMIRLPVPIGRLIGQFDYYLRPFKPALIYYVLKNQIQSKQQINRLQTLDIAIGYECNMKCEHCSAQIMSNKGKKKLSLPDYKNINKELDRLGLFRINITGGEPLLYPWLEDLVKILNPYRRHIKIQTNGSLLNEPRIVSLKKAGVNAISMSLDSLDEKEFERFRGLNGSFQKIISNIQLVRKYGLQISLGCVVTHQNLNSGEIEEIIKFSAQQKCHLLLNIAIAIGRWANREEFLFSREGQDRLRLNKLLKAYPHIHTDHDATGCPAGIRKLYLTPYGDVIPCPFLHVVFGNIKTESLSNIRRRILINFPLFNSLNCPAGESMEVYEKWLKEIWNMEEIPVHYSALARLQPKP